MLQIAVGAHRFTYDNVYGSGGGDNATSLYPDCVQPLVDGLFKGYNATVFAYGERTGQQPWQSAHAADKQTLRARLTQPQAAIFAGDNIMFACCDQLLCPCRTLLAAEAVAHSYALSVLQ